MKNFRTFNQAKDLYKVCEKLPLKGNPRDQMIRAALSICLNLAEGSAKQTEKERRRFYYIALGSQRELQCILELTECTSALELSDYLGACIYKLIKSLRC